MRRTLTDRAVAGLKAPETGRTFLWDRDPVGFGVMATSTGARSFIYETRYPGSPNPARRSLGKVGVITLAQARQKALRWRSLIAQGIDPAEHEASQRSHEARQKALTFEVVAERFVAERLAGLRTAETTAQEVRSYLISRWGSRPITSITVDDVVSLCDEFREADKAIHGRKIVGHASRVFRWAIARRALGVSHNPAAGLDLSDLLAPLRTRERTLDDAEIRAIWRASETAGYPMGALVRLLMATALRRSEAAEGDWREVDLSQRRWTIPASRMKSKRDHVVPLSTLALQVLDGLPRFTGGGCMFSTTDGSVSVSGFTKMKLRFDRLVAVELGRQPEPWTLHDIRRSVRSRLSEIGVQPVVAEAVLAHALPGLLRTYDRFDYAAEKADALERWATRLRELTQ